MKKILVIDDEPTVAHLIAAALRSAGIQHTIDYCSDGAQGRRKAARGGYDLITLDRNMPVMTGDQALREIKRNRRCASVPVVVITAQKDPDFHEHVVELGAAALIVKPFHPRDLGAILQRILAGEPPDPEP